MMGAAVVAATVDTDKQQQEQHSAWGQDRTGVQTWPSAWHLAWEADRPKAETTLTHEGEEDDEGSGVPLGLERPADLQFPQHFLDYRLQLLQVVHLSWRVPGATCSAHQREPLRTLGSGARLRTGLPQSSPCPFHTTTPEPLFYSSPCSALWSWS